ncbi:MAG: cytosol nonspecific dipeptidase [Candidatus Neomarinimicrobiota bacterium]|nr:MAG: cytosol nonspecific dipeptidase [Candidatus Neomarinimicrobiota bacterium]
MKYVFEGLKPARLWQYFYELNQIPRESKHEADAAQYIIKVAKELQLPYKQDEVGNVLVTKPATPGYEDRPKVCLQGHLDMVCEKNSGTEHDFRKDPIRMKIDGDYIRAEGTTLGADNGIGVAAALTVMASTDMVHPPMEFLFTIDEETGLTGANALKPGFVTADILINGDSEEDGALYVGCAGGKDTEISLPVSWVGAPENFIPLLVKITGLKGGHSGLDIALGRGNANKLLNRLLWNADTQYEFHLASFSGGSKHNAIPREAEAVLLVKSDNVEGFKSFVDKYGQIFNTEYRGIEKEIKIVVENTANPGKVFSRDLQTRLLNLIYALPHGVVAMSFDIPDLVETSTSLAIVRTEENSVSVLTSQRSSVETAKDDIADQVKATGLLAGGTVHQGGGYPGWNPNMDSKILQTMKTVSEDLFGKTPEVKAIHAGLECGIIGKTVPGIDMISFGPTIKNPHSPDEVVEIKTVENFWNLLQETLKRIATQ